MHKCSSSTVQNILMRYGLENGLDFVLPSDGNYLGSPEPFNKHLIPEVLSTPNGKYNIFTHHTRWNRFGVYDVMYPGAVWVTILRNPATLYESLYAYYGFSKLYNTTFADFCKNPSNVTKAFTVRLNRRTGINQMSWDLGMDPKNFNNNIEIARLISKVNGAFDLVMITEYMEMSLVLLADLMNWPLEKVVSLKLNSRIDANKNKLTPDQIKTLLDVNSADTKLYNFFIYKFKQAVLRYGKERMTSDVERLIELNRQLFIKCVEKSNNAGYAKTVSYNVSKTPQCKYAAISELEFTDIIRNFQKERLIKLKQLYDFLNG